MIIQMITKDNCKYCEMSKNLLKDQEISFLESKLGVNITKEQVLEMYPKFKTVPLCLIDGRVLGGYEELVHWVYYNQDREEIFKQLKKNILEVAFQKVNGERRLMNCTLQQKYLPEQTDIEESENDTESNNIAVWDIDADGWRSFKVDSVITWKVKNDD